jgi:hypothetical protein
VKHHQQLLAVVEDALRFRSRTTCWLARETAAG